MKRKSLAQSSGKSKGSKKLKIEEYDESGDDGQQEISDDGMDVTTLGQGNFTESDEISDDDANSDGEDQVAEEREEEEDSGPHARGAKGTNTVYRAPTTQEIRTIKEASDLFKSGSFKMQIDALLPTVRPKSSHLAPLEKALFELHSLISNMPDIAPKAPLRAAEYMKGKGVSIPYPAPLPTEDVRYEVAFRKPNSIKVVGSWGNKLTVMSKDGLGFDVDLALEMPSDLFDAKDYLNSRFFHKRAYYLAVVARAISKSKALSVDVEYVSPDDDARRTHLTLRPKPVGTDMDFTKSKASIRIYLTISETSFPIPFSRFSPSHSNLRIANSPENKATPIYNNIILQSLTPTSHLLSLHHFKTEVPAFGEALALLRVWANQRGYTSKGKQVVHGFESISGSWWGHLLGLLVFGEAANTGATGRKPLARGLSSYQLFRGTLDFLAKNDLSQQHIMMKGTTDPKFPHDEHGLHQSHAFVDQSGRFDFFCGVPSESIRLIQHDASLTLSALDQDPEAFGATFLTDMRDKCARFDIVVRVDISGARPKADSPWDRLDRGCLANSIVHGIYDVVRHALGTRARHIGILHAPSGARPISVGAASPRTSIDIGVILQPSEAGRLVDHGPPAGDEVGGAEFRDFWGAKAELRRFKDGSIQESVVWEPPTADTRIHIPMSIMEHVLQHHFGLSSQNVTFWGRELAELIIPPEVSNSGSEAAGSRQALAAFDSLVKAIKSVDEDVVPLSLAHVYPSSPLLRHTHVLPPTPAELTSKPQSQVFIPPIDVIIAYEQSSKWPDDLAAIQKVKLAFLEALARELASSVHSTAVVLDTDADVIEDNCALEILTNDGFAFRARIFCELEKPLLKRFVGPKPKNWKAPSEYNVSKDEAKRALALHERRFTASPAHHNALTAVHHRYPSFGPTVRLAVRWLASHLLLPHVPFEILELICAHVYLCPGAWGVPATSSAGFARVIRLLREWDYKDTPLCVPLYADHGSAFDKEKVKEVESAFKDKVGEASWTVVTEKDIAGMVFGNVFGPRGAIPARVKQVATATWKRLCSGTEDGTLIIKELFTHPLDHYNFIIHLNVKVLTRYHENLQYNQGTKWRPDIGDGHEMGSKPVVGFDPAASFFADLQRIYNDTAIFFYDPLGGAVIAGAWNPQLQAPRPFKVFAGYSFVPTDTAAPTKKPMVVLNERAVLAEIERLGSGIIDRIIVRK